MQQRIELRAVVSMHALKIGPISGSLRRGAQRDCCTFRRSAAGRKSWPARRASIGHRQPQENHLPKNPRSHLTHKLTDYSHWAVHPAVHPRPTCGRFSLKVGVSIWFSTVNSCSSRHQQCAGRSQELAAPGPHLGVQVDGLHLLKATQPCHTRLFSHAAQHRLTHRSCRAGTR
jgi:hypothetical protein